MLAAHRHRKAALRFLYEAGKREVTVHHARAAAALTLLGGTRADARCALATLRFAFMDGATDVDTLDVLERTVRSLAAHGDEARAFRILARVVGGARVWVASPRAAWA